MAYSRCCEQLNGLPKTVSQMHRLYVVGQCPGVFKFLRAQVTLGLLHGRMRFLVQFHVGFLPERVTALFTDKRPLRRLYVLGQVLLHVLLGVERLIAVFTLGLRLDAVPRQLMGFVGSSGEERQAAYLAHIALVVHHLHVLVHAGSVVEAHLTLCTLERRLLMPQVEEQQRQFLECLLANVAFGFLQFVVFRQVVGEPVAV
jgi:hypothetical protein